jgi:uncharacterized protein YukE
MASDFIDIDTGVLRSNADGFDAVSASASSAYSKLLNEINRLGHFWGDDKASRKFDEDYSQSSQDQLDGMTALIDSFRNIADSIRETAKQYDQAESAAQGQ